MPVHPLSPRFLEKVWGSQHLEPWFPDSPSAKIGEVWLESPSGVPLPLLIKFLFTTENLSVQVHPGDEHARIYHSSAGKTEMWHILRADPNAQIALGLTQSITQAELREASQSGAIERLLNWIEVHPGDTFLVPAGTIHAIGAGVAVCEIQQQSDVTYRLYDYGRPRELHLDESITVADLEAFVTTPQPADCLAASRYFRTERLRIDHNQAVQPPQGSDPARWLICIDGSGAIDGFQYKEGQAFEANAGASPVIEPQRASIFLQTWVPAANF